MDQGVNGAGGEDGEGKALQQLGDEDRLISEHALMGQTFLGPAGEERQDGDVGDLAAGAAGGGDQHQVPGLLQGKLAIVKVQDGGDMLEDQELGDVQHPAAAHGNDPGDLLGHIPVDGLHHLV